MFKIEVFLKDNKWYGVFYFFNKEPWVIQINYLSITRPQIVVDDMKARNPDINVYLLTTPNF
jgi:hypothetical protein